MEPIKLAIAIVALAVSVLSLFISQLASRRAKKAEDVKALLGEKEAVAFAGLKLLRDGLPRDGRQSTLIIRALVQACLFEGSDRARALLYRVIEKNREHHREDFLKAVESIEETFTRMDSYKFSSEELDLSRGRRRLRALQLVVNGVSEGEPK